MKVKNYFILFSEYNCSMLSMNEMLEWYECLNGTNETIFKCYGEIGAYIEHIWEGGS